MQQYFPRVVRVEYQKASHALLLAAAAPVATVVAAVGVTAAAAEAVARVWHRR